MGEEDEGGWVQRGTMEWWEEAGVEHYSAHCWVQKGLLAYFPFMLESYKYSNVKFMTLILFRQTYNLNIFLALLTLADTSFQENRSKKYGL